MQKCYSETMHFQKGYTPWIKGKTKETSEIIKKYSEDPERRKKLSHIMKGKNRGKTPMLGKKHSEETKRKISETRKRLFAEGKLIISTRGKYIPQKHFLCLYCNKEFMNIKNRKYCSNNCFYASLKDRQVSEEAKEKMSERRKKFWAENKEKYWLNPEWREKILEAQLKGLFKRPTSLEKQMIEIIEKNNLPFKYCGDGSVLIGYKNPDFVESDGKKICLEVRNKEITYFNKTSLEDYEKKRKEHFAKYGWKCIVFFADRKLDEQEIIKVAEFKV